MNKAALLLTDSTSDIRCWPTPRSKTWTLHFLNDVSDNHNFNAIVAVGSAVRPGVPCADLDLVVMCSRPADLRIKPPLEIDVRKYRADQVHEELERGNDLLGWAVKFGRVLFQREGYWDAILRYWCGRLPLPSPDVAAQRAVRAFSRLVKVVELGDLDAAEEQALSYVTHFARAELLKRNTYPASTPELPAQLWQIGIYDVADFLEQLIDRAVDHLRQISILVETGGQICYKRLHTKSVL